MIHPGNHVELHGLADRALAGVLHNTVEIAHARRCGVLLIAPPVIEQQLAATREERLQVVAGRVKYLRCGIHLRDIGGRIELGGVPGLILCDQVLYVSLAFENGCGPARRSTTTPIPGCSSGV